MSVCLQVNQYAYKSVIYPTNCTIFNFIYNTYKSDAYAYKSISALPTSKKIHDKKPHTRNLHKNDINKFREKK